MLKNYLYSHVVNGNMACLNFGLGGGGGIGCSSERLEARKNDANEEASQLAPGKGRQEETETVIGKD